MIKLDISGATIVYNDAIEVFQLSSLSKGPLAMESVQNSVNSVEPILITMTDRQVAVYLRNANVVSLVVYFCLNRHSRISMFLFVVEAAASCLSFVMYFSQSLHQGRRKSFTGGGWVFLFAVLCPIYLSCNLAIIFSNEASFLFSVFTKLQQTTHNYNRMTSGGASKIYPNTSLLIHQFIKKSWVHFGDFTSPNDRRGNEDRKKILCCILKATNYSLHSPFSKVH